MIVRSAGVLVLLFVSLAMPKTAAGDGGTKVYRAQFIELHGKLSLTLERVGKTRDSLSEEERDTLREEMLAMLKLTHRLEEEAQRANLERMQRGNQTDKNLLTIAIACTGMSLTLKTLDDYVATGDRSFAIFARESENFTKLVEKSL
jgi:hypothetical protein